MSVLCEKQSYGRGELGLWTHQQKQAEARQSGIQVQTWPFTECVSGSPGQIALSLSLDCSRGAGRDC